MGSGEVGDRSSQSLACDSAVRRPDVSGRGSPLVPTLWPILRRHSARSNASSAGAAGSKGTGRPLRPPGNTAGLRHRPILLEAGLRSILLPAVEETQPE